MFKKIMGGTLLLSTSLFVIAEQYNLSLNYEPVMANNGAITTSPAVNVDTAWGVDIQDITMITEGVYRISGWGIGNIIAVQAPEGWIIIDAGDSVTAAKEQRAALEKKLNGKIEVEAILYTHSHYVWGASVWQGDNTKVYAHEWMEKHLLADNGVSPLSGNFNARAVIQFGMLHPEKGPDAFPNKLGFSLDKLSAEKGYLSPEITFTHNEIESHRIAGTEVVVLPSPTDVTDSVAYYFPEKSLMVTNAVNGDSTIFNLYTLRGDRYRDPIRLVEAADLVLSYDFDYHVDIHGAANVTRQSAIDSIQAFRDSMQLIHDQTIRAISLGKDAQGAAEFVYFPEAMRKDKETYGQVESHVKQVYNGTVGWNGWDVYDINPMRSNEFAHTYISSLGGAETATKMVRSSNQKQTVEGWQWSLYLTSQLLEVDPINAEVKQFRADAARALGQRTSSANARGFYISEALLHEGQLSLANHSIDNFQTLSQMLGSVDKNKLEQSPIENNVNYLRYLVDTRKAESLHAQFNLKMSDSHTLFGIELRNGIIQISPQPNNGVTVSLSHSQWSNVVLGNTRFNQLDASLGAFDTALTIN
ncbi:Alkyl sulfatase and related hydrolase-like protein [Shewanella halifaxensis HAW-EB4]|uniref:Alkyl sulfatase and related hydrolase-like protein n=1 Tax=Shewanella halifaxensis (strain HAW-EB4) TaxID=458817 RepID=B0TMQ1_SHEHH|nr:alkyl sulfatase dimerization domain-containing protein [Shewanella halifaxensis]ABZ77411.1 Alkyl sulfatase and related hydrolase-like protein [Shewanella halifaxensis HAW-EB4]